MQLKGHHTLMFDFEKTDVIPFCCVGRCYCHVIVVDVITTEEDVTSSIIESWQMLLPYDIVVDVENLKIIRQPFSHTPFSCLKIN